MWLTNLQKPLLFKEQNGWQKIKSFIILTVLRQGCNKLARSISASLRSGTTSLFKGMLQRRRAVDNIVSDLTAPRFEPQTFRSRDERVTTQPQQLIVRNKLLRQLYRLKLNKKQKNFIPSFCKLDGKRSTILLPYTSIVYIKVVQ